MLKSKFSLGTVLPLVDDAKKVDRDRTRSDEIGRDCPPWSHTPRPVPLCERRLFPPLCCEQVGANASPQEAAGVQISARSRPVSHPC